MPDPAPSLFVRAERKVASKRQRQVNEPGSSPVLTRDPHFQTRNAAELRRVIAHLVRAR
ncbi:MAG: hypothetical protein WBM75_19550 [Polyangiales bacterium]